MTDETHQLIIYTDGSSRGNPAWRIWSNFDVGDQTKRIICGLPVNNEQPHGIIRCVITALESLKKRNIPVTIYTDSQYIVKAIQQGWLTNGFVQTLPAVKE
jgi:ribonuclease HI